MGWDGAQMEPKAAPRRWSDRQEVFPGRVPITSVTEAGVTGDGAEAELCVPVADKLLEFVG